MSDQITTAMVNQYKANVELLSQQKGSRFRNAVRVETLTGETGFFEQIDQTAAQLKTSRHQDTPQIDTPHKRRKVSMSDYIWADLIDPEDKARILIDPKGKYAVNAVNAFGRAMDDAIIAAATGTAYTGKAGTTAVALPAAQKISVSLSGSSEGLTIGKLIEAKRLLWAADVDEDIPLYFACTSQQLADLLALEKATSSDYANVKALVKGEIDTFMGFTFIRTERLTLTTATDVRTCFAWAMDGLMLALGRDIQTRVSERPDKNYAEQVWAGMSIGATRMEEVKVIEVPCDESP